MGTDSQTYHVYQQLRKMHDPELMSSGFLALVQNTCFTVGQLLSIVHCTTPATSLHVPVHHTGNTAKDHQDILWHGVTATPVISISHSSVWDSDKLAVRKMHQTSHVGL